MRHYLRLAATCSVLILATAVQAQVNVDSDVKESATRLSASTNYDFTTGAYGTAYQLPSTTWSVGALWDINEDWSLDVDLPYLRQTSPIVVGNTTVRVVRIGGKLVAVKGTTSVTNLQSTAGQGDITALLTRSFDGGSGPVWSVGMKVKFATANAAAGLGTGKNDVSLQTGVINDLGPWTLGATAGYTLVGSVTGLALRNAAYLDLDGSYKINDRWSLGVSMSLSQSPVSGSSAPVSTSASASYKISKKSYVSLSMLRGLSEASPKWGAGLGLNLSF